MISKIIGVIMLVILSVIFYKKNYYKKIFKKKEKFGHIQYGGSLKNIYNEPLEKCQEDGMDDYGSWDSNGKCSELNGGVHQICIKNIASKTPNFSSDTGQDNWSDNRGTNNHCVCLGAWSLYNKKNSGTTIPDNTLKCDAIPKIALSNAYVTSFIPDEMGEGWDRWNGLEQTNQIVNGVESLFNQCYKGSSTKKANLKNNYCNFAKDVPELKNRNLYRTHCET